MAWLGCGVSGRSRPSCGTSPTRRHSRLAGSRWAGAPSRLAPENTTLWTESLRELRSRPELLDGAVTAWASAVSAMFVHRRPAIEAIDRVIPPVLLLWGDRDRLITRPVIDYLITRRPDWTLRVLGTAGHLAPLEFPDTYATVIGQWLSAAPNAAGAVDDEIN